MVTISQNSDHPVPLVELVRAAQLPTPARRRRIRLDAKVSLRQMAAALNVNPMTVLRWENGEQEPRLEHAAAYRQLLDQLEEAIT